MENLNENSIKWPILNAQKKKKKMVILLIWIERGRRGEIHKHYMLIMQKSDNIILKILR